MCLTFAVMVTVLSEATTLLHIATTISCIKKLIGSVYGKFVVWVQIN